MPFHPYISGAGNITQMIHFLRKSFPATVNSDTVKKLGIAPKNESYVLNVLQFIGVIDKEGNRTDRGHEILTTHNEEQFRGAFKSLIKDSYKDLFDLRGDDAWSMNKNELIGYFRNSDKTSEVIGTRQAAVFQALKAIVGYGEILVLQKSSSGKTTTKISNSKSKKLAYTPASSISSTPVTLSKKNMALTVRIEINLPTEASAETYDNIFKSIRANLLND